MIWTSNRRQFKFLRRCAVSVPLGLTPENLVQAEECLLQQAVSRRSDTVRNEAVRETSLQPVTARDETDMLAPGQAPPLHAGPTEPISYHERYVDAQEGAAFLGLHPKTLMRLAREGEVIAYSISEGTRRHWRFLISELDKWMKSKVNSSAHPVRSVSQGRRK